MDLCIVSYLGIFLISCQAISILLKSDKHSASQAGLYIFLQTSSAYTGLPIIPCEKQGNVSLAFSVQWKEVANYFKVVVY
jgi:hypothetical protein